MESTQSFGSRMRAAREARGLSLQALGEKLGLGVSYLSSIELGRSRPSEETLGAICAALELDLDEMAGRAGILGALALAYLQRHPEIIADIRAKAREEATAAKRRATRRK